MKTHVNIGSQTAAGKKIMIILFLLLILISMTKAQDTNETKQGTIKVSLIDRQSYKPLPFANVILSENGRQVTIQSTNKNGEVEFNDVKPGTYNIKSFEQGFLEAELQGINLEAEDELTITLKLQSATILPQELPQDMLLQQAQVQSRKKGHAFLQITANVLTIICYVIGRR
jgi:hypothetical protein